MIAPAPALIRIRDLSFSYPGSRSEVLRIPVLDISGRGLIAITGPSGAGKSTLIELVAGTLREPYGGSLKVLGHEWRDLTADSERQRHIRRIGLIPQDYGLLTSRTPKQMLEQDLSDAQVPAIERPGRISDSLAQVGMAEFAERPIAQLSGGQRQRVAIARMLARDVELVIADEPTANLDRDLTWQTIRILRQLANKVPVLVITHEAEVAEACDRTIVLQGLPPAAGGAPARPASISRRTALISLMVTVVVAAAAVAAWGLTRGADSAPHKAAANAVSSSVAATPALASTPPAESLASTSVAPTAATEKTPPTAGNTPASTPRPTPEPTPVPVTPALLIAAAACPQPCTITGTVPFTDPVEGASTLVTVLNEAPGAGDASSAGAFMVAVDEIGRVTWKYQLPGGYWESLEPVRDKPIDKTGHIFLTFNPGRYDGVIVLDPVGDGFNDFGSLPVGNDPYQWRFYSSTVIDPAGSGVYVIETDTNTCEPSCAEGSNIQSFSRWNGTDYTK